MGPVFVLREGLIAGTILELLDFKISEWWPAQCFQADFQIKPRKSQTVATDHSRDNILPGDVADISPAMES